MFIWLIVFVVEKWNRLRLKNLSVCGLLINRSFKTHTKYTTVDSRQLHTDLFWTSNQIFMHSNRQTFTYFPCTDTFCPHANSLICETEITKFQLDALYLSNSSIHEDNAHCCLKRTVEVFVWFRKLLLLLQNVYRKLFKMSFLPVLYSWVTLCFVFDAEFLP